MKTKDKLALGAIGLVIVTMPVSGMYVLESLDWAFQQVFIYGAWVTAVACVYLMGYILHSIWLSREQVNIPKKSAKTVKAGKFIAS